VVKFRNRRGSCCVIQRRRLRVPMVKWRLGRKRIRGESVTKLTSFPHGDSIPYLGSGDRKCQSILLERSVGPNACCLHEPNPSSGQSIIRNKERNAPHTLSPFWKSVTPSPTSTTSPAKSRPRIVGTSSTPPF